MCRWLAYSGSPILLEELLSKPTHSLIDQSMHARLGATTTNGDGFGVGWYGTGPSRASFLPSGRPGATATSGSWPAMSPSSETFTRSARPDLAVDLSLYPFIEGSADSEVMFFLALSFGLEHDPRGGRRDGRLHRGHRPRARHR